MEKILLRCGMRLRFQVPSSANSYSPRGDACSNLDVGALIDPISRYWSDALISQFIYSL